MHAGQPHRSVASAAPSFGSHRPRPGELAAKALQFLPPETLPAYAERLRAGQKTFRVPTVLDLEKTQEALQHRLTTTQAEVDRQMAKVRARWTPDPAIAVSLPDVERDVEEQIRVSLDRELTQLTLWFFEDYAVALADVTGRLQASRQPPKEPDHTLAALRELLVRQRFTGATRAELLDEYARTGDAENPTLVQFVEDPYLQASLRLRPEEDAETIAIVGKRVQDAIKARQQAREPRALLELRAAIMRVPTFSMGESIRMAQKNQIYLATAQFPALRATLKAGR
jgi:hypothetical protein